MKKWVVVGIGTGVGKTYVSAVLVAGLNAFYWKPVQAGIEPTTDTKQISQWLDLPPERIIPSAYTLTKPESPHSAAAAEGIYIDQNQLAVPNINENLIIEGAGGVMVPLNEHLWYIDVLQNWRLPVILVVDGYLGCINHTLLTWEALMYRNIKVKGLIFNRIENSSAPEYLAKATGANIIGFLPQQNHLQGWEEFKSCFDEYLSF